MADVITVTVLDDGRVVIETEGVSAANHTSAERLMDELSKTMGGEIAKKKRKARKHEHGHGQKVHQH